MKKVKRIKVVKPEIELVDTSHRVYIGLEFSFKQEETNITKKIISKIEKSNILDAVVQIQIKIWESDLDNLDIEKIYKACKGAYYVRPIVPIINRLQTTETSDITIDMNPVEAVEKFIEKYSPDDSKEILDKALKIMKGEYECI